MMSANLSFSIVPIWSSICIAQAPFLVAVVIASTGVKSKELKKSLILDHASVRTVSMQIRFLNQKELNSIVIGFADHFQGLLNFTSKNILHSWASLNSDPKSARFAKKVKVGQMDVPLDITASRPSSSIKDA